MIKVIYLFLDNFAKQEHSVQIQFYYVDSSLVISWILSADCNMFKALFVHLTIFYFQKHYEIVHEN
jgi:hypothetical protein